MGKYSCPNCGSGRKSEIKSEKATTVHYECGTRLVMPKPNLKLRAIDEWIVICGKPRLIDKLTK